MPHDLNHVRLLWQKQNILRELFINISRIVGISRRTSVALSVAYPIPRDLLKSPVITRLAISVDAGRPYLFVRKQNFLKNISKQKTPHFFFCNKINCLSFTAFNNFKLA